MLFISGVLIVFSVLLFVLCLYHLFVWDNGWYVSGNVRSWASPFECGFMPHRLLVNYFSFSFLLLLVFFVVFDLEVSLLLNVPFEGLLYKNLASYMVFICFLFFGYVYEVEGGYVSWDF